MATHFKTVDPALRGGMYQAFSNDTSLTDAVVIATGDYIDFQSCFGRPAKKLVIMINGAVDVYSGVASASTNITFIGY